MAAQGPTGPEGRTGDDERRRAWRRSRPYAPAATIRIPFASTARTRWARCASTGTRGSTTGVTTDDVVRVAGRVVSRRVQGKLVFATASATAPARCSSSSNKAELGDDAFARFVDEVDRGDWVGVEGAVMKTKKGELSVNVKTFALLAKSLRPLPEKWHGLTDTDTRFRQRYVDLIANDDARRVFAVRFAAIARRCAASSSSAASSRSRRRCCTVHPGSRRGPAVHHAPQRARRRLLPADRARALPEAARRRWHRPRVRDRARVPQRGPVDASQSRVHDARALRGVRRLHRHDAAHRGADRRRPRARRSARPWSSGTAARSISPRRSQRAPMIDLDQGARRCERASRRIRSRACARSATTSTFPYEDALGIGQARARDLREDDRGEDRGSDVRVRLPARGLAARARAPRRSRRSPSASS